MNNHFRVWSLSSKDWLFPSSKVKDYCGGNGKSLNLWCHYKAKGFEDGLSVHGISKSTTVFQLATGLKDKKGGEIYEGDIVYNPSESLKYVVKFGSWLQILEDREIEQCGFYLDMVNYIGKLEPIGDDSSKYIIIGHVNES